MLRPNERMLLVIKNEQIPMVLIFNSLFLVSIKTFGQTFHVHFLAFSKLPFWREKVPFNICGKIPQKSWGAFVSNSSCKLNLSMPICHKLLRFCYRQAWKTTDIASSKKFTLKFFRRKGRKMFEFWKRKHWKRRGNELFYL